MYTHHTCTHTYMISEFLLSAVIKVEETSTILFFSSSFGKRYGYLPDTHMHQRPLI